MDPAKSLAVSLGLPFLADCKISEETEKLIISPPNSSIYQKVLDHGEAILKAAQSKGQSLIVQYRDCDGDHTVRWPINQRLRT